MLDVECEEVPRRQKALDNIYYYRPISLFSTFCVGLCMFGMEYGFVTNSTANKCLWGVLSLIFLVSQTLLHFVDKSTGNRLSQLPHLLNASEPLILLRLYRVGLFQDVVSLALLLCISYFFVYPEPIIASIQFVLLTTSWYTTNEIRAYFVKTLEDIARNTQQDVLNSFDGINACAALYIAMYYVWIIVFIHHIIFGSNSNIYIEVMLFVVTIIQGMRLWYHVYVFDTNKRAQSTQTIVVRIVVFINNAVLSNLVFAYGLNNDSDIFRRWAMGWKIDSAQYLMMCYGLNTLIAIRQLMPIHNRIQCILLSMVIILETVSLSPNVLNSPYRQIMLMLTLLNLLVSIVVTVSLSSFMACWGLRDKLVYHLAFPKLFLGSYLVGIMITNASALYMIFKVYYSKVNYVWHETEQLQVMSLNCSYYECFNLMLMMAMWWPIAVLINNENTRFLYRYRNSEHACDGSRPLIPILFVVLLLSFEIGLIQSNKCLSSPRLLCSCLVIIVIVFRIIMLVLSV
eukprot:470240_1